MESATNGEMSFKNLWSILKDTGSQRSPQFVGKELEKHGKRLLQGVCFFDKPNAVSSKKFKDLKLDSNYQDLVTKFSQFLDLDVMQTYNLFCSFLEANNDVDVSSNDRYFHLLVRKMFNYYYSERLFLIQCVKQILRYWQESLHPYRDLFEGYLEMINKNGALATSLMDQFKLVSTTPVPSKIVTDINIGKELTTTWATYNLNEQCELLQCLLLYFKDLECKSSDFHNLLTIFQQHSFGMRQMGRIHFDDRTKSLQKSVSYLEALVIIENMEIDWLLESEEADRIKSYTLLKDKETWKKIEKSLTFLGSMKEHSPIILTWMVAKFLLQSESESIATQHLLAKLGNCILHHDVFSYLLEILNSPITQEASAVSKVSNTLIYGLLTSVLSIFQESTVGIPQKILQEIAEKLLKLPNIANDFWERGLGLGFGIQVSKVQEKFPHEFHPFMQLMTSLASSNATSCQQVMTVIQNLPKWCEILDNSTTQYLEADENNRWILLRKRVLYNSESVFIPAYTVGFILDGTSLPLIQWQCKINGWQVFLCEIDSLIQSVSLGISNVRIGSIDRVVAIYRLVTKVWSVDPNLAYKMQHLSDMVYGLIHAFISYDTKLVAICLELVGYQIQLEGSDAVWKKLSQTGILPYSVTKFDVTKKINEINPGKLSHVIQSREVSGGEFDVTIAFLRLVQNTVEQKAVEANDYVTASITYVINHIFTKYQKWNFTDISDYKTVEYSCLKIFHNILSGQTGNDIYHRACSLGLLQSSASNSLIQLFEQFSYDMKASSLNPAAIEAEKSRVVQIALYLVNRLYQVTNQDGEKTTLMQSVSFLTTIAELIVLRLDTKITTLAVILLQTVAKEEGVLLASSLGKLADTLCRYLLQTLECGNVVSRLRIAILEFLTVCIYQQPGIIELCLGKDSEPDSTSSNLLNLKKKRKNCIEIVSGILTTSSSVEENDELFSSAVEFVHSVWKCRRRTMMNELRKAPNFWSNLSSCLWETSSSRPDLERSSHVFKIFALEIFLTASGRKDTATTSSPDVGFKDVVKKLTSDQMLSTWSVVVNESILNGVDGICDQTVSQEPNKNDCDFLLISWRDFLMILAKTQSSILSAQQKTALTKDILQTMRRLSVDCSTPKNMVHLSELYFYLRKSWQSQCSFEGDWYDDLVELLSNMSVNQDRLHVRSLIAVLATVILSVHDCRSQLDKHLIATLIPPVCVLLQHSLLAGENNLDPKANLQQQLPVLCISTLQELVSSLEDSNLWLPVLQQHVIIPTLSSTLCQCLQAGKAPTLCLNIISLCVQLATYPSAAQVLSHCGLNTELCLSLANAYSSKIPPSQTGMWTNIYNGGVRLVTMMLKSLGHFQQESTLDFVGVHMERMVTSLVETRYRLFDLEETIITLTLINEMVKYGTNWRVAHPISYQCLLNGVCASFHATVAYLMRPALIQRIMEQHAGGAEITESVRVRRLSSTEEVEKPSPELVQVQSKLFDVMALCLCVLRQISPDLSSLLSQQSVDLTNWEQLFQINFSTPSPEQDAPLSFGTIIVSVNICLKLLTKGERAPSPARMQPVEIVLPVEKYRLALIMENSLTIMLSQALLCLLSADLSSRDKQMVKRELATELDSFVQSITRYNIRRTTGAGGSSSTPSTAAVLPDQAFIRLVVGLVNKLFK